MRPLRSLALLALVALAGTATAQTSTAPQPRACPAEVPAGATCHIGEDGLGGFYWIALPAQWKSQTGVLVVHAHGGPADTGPATLARGEEDLKRWAVTVKAGYAWVGATYRRGGFGVSMAAEDTERARRVFVKHFGPPRRTILHGQSYGASVAAKGAELYAMVDGPNGPVKGPYDGMLLTSGMLGGGTRAYDFRMDLRVVYQYVCRNHPKPDELQYPLWQGLPMDAKLTRAELAARVDECTGVRKPAAQRTEQQKANLANIVNVIKIPERSLIAHLNWATWLFRDLTQLRLGNRNPFNNASVQYKGSTDDAALNAGVLRYTADPVAVAELARDSDPQGRINIPVLSLHAVNDPTAFVELESAYRETLERAGKGAMLVQTFSDESEHSYLSDPQYPALFTALLNWIDKNDKPTPQTVAALCKGYEAAYGDTCKLLPDYRSAPLASRVPLR
ncbi:alpha/beta hydrolase family protein [Hydrogenophaga sp.]|uniref:alpha/beta hydrolase family protein n=1 Tax=Hydrogenophaga sp. TaxID=1904254 RepID=UPI003F6F9B38